MIEQINILIPDGESTWTINVLHCLRDQKQLKIHIISAQQKTAVKFSNVIDSYTYCEVEEKRLEIINTIVKEKQIHLILPIAEESCEMLINNRGLIDSSAKIILLPEINDYRTAIDKNKLYNFLVNNNLPTPRSVYIKKSDIQSDYITNLNFPVLVKPLNQKGGEGIKKFENVNDLKNFMVSGFNHNDLFIQEYINGYDIDCSVLCYDGEIIAHTIQKGFLSAKSPYTPQLGFIFLQNNEVYKVVSNVMKALNWNGIAHLDLRYDKKTKDYKLIEINARFWGSTEASKAAGINFPLQLILKSLNFPLSQTDYRNGSFIRYKGLLKQPSKLFYWRFIKNNTDLSAVLKDPLPTLYRFKEWLFRKM